MNILKEMREEQLTTIGHGVKRVHKLSVPSSVGLTYVLKLSMYHYQFIFVWSCMYITKREEMASTYFRMPNSSIHSVNLVCLTFKKNWFKRHNPDAAN